MFPPLLVYSGYLWYVFLSKRQELWRRASSKDVKPAPVTQILGQAQETTRPDMPHINQLPAPAAGLPQRKTSTQGFQSSHHARSTPQPGGAAQAPLPQLHWKFCASQWDTCICSGKIRFGNGDTWLEVPLKAGQRQQAVQCSVVNLRDVLPGADKHCECLSLQARQKPEQAGAVWIFCAPQWQECQCQGTVRWGNRNTWFHIEPKAGENDTVIKCNVQALPDNLPGDDSKHCECLATPGTELYSRINPGLLPTASDAHLPIGSCENFAQGASEQPCGAQMWAAAEAFCSADWDSRAGVQAGDRAMEKGTLQGLMRLWVEPRFRGNYERLYNKSGWIPRAFLNYYAGVPGGKHARMTEELIRSVHLFSSEPIVVVSFGFATPAMWQPERFPRLILFAAAPLPSSASRSFNFNKLRAMLLTRVLVGVQLDSDQFVAPGVDAIFQRVEQEITQSYPMPILPAHFLDWGPSGEGPGGKGAKLWDRFCPEGREGKCRWQTARWGHAHPTWTFWALPFLGRWLRRNFRDEWLPAGDGKQALRVLDVKEDEDLLNVGTWEEGGTKQWCKFDLPDPTEFDTWLATQPVRHGRHTCLSGMCGNIVSDPRYNPKGIAKAFYTAHHAVEPDITRKYVDRLLSRRNSKGLLPPILYEHNFYEDGAELHRAHPDVRCII